MRPYAATRIETERLLLRPFERGDLEAVLDLYGREDVMRYLYEVPADQATAAAIVSRKMAGTAVTAEGGRISLAAFAREDGAFVGDGVIGVASVEHEQAELGFVIHPDHQRRGFATELAVELLRIGFDEIGAHRVFGRAEARNAASARVMEKVGMRREAHLVENEWVKGEWQSELVYAILEREWRARRSDRP
jgi:RimJ/RimL family protein N-acetyltransferase